MSTETEVHAHPTGAELALDSSKFLAHLNAYPTLGALAGYAGSFPLVKALADHSVPILLSLGESTKPLSHPVLSRIDSLGDNLLNHVDASFPILKDTTPQQVLDVAKRPIETIKNTTNLYTSAVKNSLDQYLVDPVVSITVSTVSTLDATTSPILNPLLSPINTRLIAFAKNYHLINYAAVAQLDEGESSGKDSSSHPSELAKTYQLSIDVIKNLRPNATAIASSTKSHVTERVGSATSQVNARVNQVKDLSNSAVTQINEKVEIAKDLSSSAISHVKVVYDKNKGSSVIGSALGTAKVLATEGLQVANDYNKKLVDENAKTSITVDNNKQRPVVVNAN